MISLRILLVVLIFLTCVLLTEVVAKLKEQQESLRGLKGVFVIVEDVGNNAEQFGLTRNLLVTEVEAKLLEANIPILTIEEMADGFSILRVPILNVLVTTHKVQGGLFAFCIKVSLDQPVVLERNLSIKTYATTWGTSSVGVVGAANLQKLREAVNDHVRDFIVDYQAMK